MIERGVIRNRKQASQIIDFSGLQFGTITPTDLDGLIDYHNRGFIIIEAKHGDSDLPYGQRLAIERLVDNLTKPTVAIIASHESEGDIDVANAIVREVRFRRKWRVITPIQTVRQFIDRFVGWLDNNTPYMPGIGQSRT